MGAAVGPIVSSLISTAGSASIARGQKKEARKARKQGASLAAEAERNRPQAARDISGNVSASKDEARRRALRQFGVGGTKQTGSLGVQGGGATAKKQTLGA